MNVASTDPASSRHYFLYRALAPLKAFLNDSEVVEISVNRPVMRMSTCARLAARSEISSVKDGIWAMLHGYKKPRVFSGKDAGLE